MLEVDKWKEKVERQREREWLIEGLLPEVHEPMLIAGRPGIGKTMLVLNLAYALATGSQWLGFRCQRVTVGCFFFEGSDQSLLERIGKVERRYPDPEDRLRLDVGSPFKLGQKAQEFADKVDGCQVVILDPLRYAVSGDYIKPADAARFLDMLRCLAVEKDFTPIICHHVRKHNQNSLIEPGDLFELKGAADYVEVANTVLMMERERQAHGPRGTFAPVNPDHRSLYFAKCRDARDELPPLWLRFDRETLAFTVLED